MMVAIVEWSVIDEDVDDADDIDDDLCFGNMCYLSVAVCGG